MKISRILHAGYIFANEGEQIAFDPIFENPFSGNCFAFPEVQLNNVEIQKLKLSAVFISHYHDDHCSLESLIHLDRDTPIYLYCLHEELFAMLRELGFVHVHALKLHQTVHIGTFAITPWRALDADVDSIFQIRCENLNILNVVDSWIDAEILQKLIKQGPWDLILWPFQTMRELEVLSPRRAAPATGDLPVEWIEQFKQLKPKYLVPSSCQFQMEKWSWYNFLFFPISYAGFTRQISQVLPNCEVVRMNPGQSFEFKQNQILPAEALSWIQPIGEQNVDYAYQPNLVVPSTSEIACHFLPLSNLQHERVIQYCTHDLLKKYASLETDDGYFRKQRIWHLSIYDHRGVESCFYYRIEKASIQLLAERVADMEWSTEVPMAKLFAAIALGESLTSMYVRINDMVFSAKVEEEIGSVDIMEDPLLRCLFNGEFGAYQRAQLQKLKKQRVGDS